MNALSEIKRKMDTENTILITVATDDLVNIIKSKVKGTRTDMTNIPEMLLLQDYCCHKNPIICTTTFQALCNFMITNNYQNQLLIDWMVVLSPQIKSKIGLIQEIFKIIVSQLKNNESINLKYINTLIDLLIKIMDDNLDEWRVILFHLKVNTNFDNYEFIRKWLNVTKRLFKFIFLSQTPSTYRISFVKLFVEILFNASDYDLVFEIYSWLQANNVDDCLFLHNFLEEFWVKIPDIQHEIKFNLCLCIIQTSIQLMSYGYDPTCMLQHLNSTLVICPCATEIVLLCVSRSLSFSSSKFVLNILNFCIKIVQNYGCHPIIAHSVVASVLQWNRTKVINSETVNFFLSTVNSDLYPSRSCTQNHVLHTLLASDSFLLTSYSLVKLCPEFNNNQFISKWLSEINQTHNIFNDDQFNFYLAGLYLCKIGDRSQQQTLLKLLNKKFLLPIIAYATNLESSHYNQFDLIKAIPTAACIQENTSLVISLIKRFENSNEEALSILSIDMYYDLWMTEVRCYRFLLYCLSTDKPGWKWNVVKLWTIKKMIKSNPNSDLAAILKQMLGLYIQRFMYLPMKLAMESLVDLSFTEYINPEALIKLIDKNVNDIHHPSIISSYCNLLAIFANQTTDNSKRNECLQKLWSMVLHSNNFTVICGLKSLSDVNLESMPLCVLPEKFRNSSKIVTQLEDLEKLDVFNGPIPGECWIKFLQNINTYFINNAQLTLSVWLRQELERKVTSRVLSDHEPKNLKHLPDHSIARGLISFIVPKRKKMLDTDDDLKLACLAVINKADRPMYSFDWSFLENYVTKGPSCKLWKESVIMVAKQSTTSTSAFRLLYKCYNHHSNLDNNQIKLLLSVLFKVSNIIYHDLQKNFVTDIVNTILNKIFNGSYSTYTNEDIDLFCHILFECKQILQSTETHMENIHFICNILENVWCVIHLENKEILYAFLECCLAMPLEVLKNLKPYPVQESMISKFVVLCCAQNLVHSNVSFDGFYECIQVCNTFAKDNILFNLITEVFTLNTFVSFQHELISNFMIYLASCTKKINFFPNDSFKIQCSIFINLIITLSGYDSISSVKDKELNYLIFPLALATFAKDSSQSSKIVEWLKTMRTIQHLPEEYCKLFYCCLAAFKNDKCLFQWANRKQIILH